MTDRCEYFKFIVISVLHVKVGKFSYRCALVDVNLMITMMMFGVGDIFGPSIKLTPGSTTRICVFCPQFTDRSEWWAEFTFHTDIPVNIGKINAFDREFSPQVQALKSTSASILSDCVFYNNL